MTLAGTNDWAKFQSLKILTKLIDTRNHEAQRHRHTQISIVSFDLWYIDIQNKSPEVEYSTYVLQQTAAIAFTFSHITIYADLNNSGNR